MTILYDTVDRCTYLGNALKPCGCKTVLGKSYCAEHIFLVYQKGTAVHRRKDKKTASAVWDLESELNQAIQELVDEGYNLAEDRWHVPLSELEG